MVAGVGNIEAFSIGDQACGKTQRQARLREAYQTRKAMRRLARLGCCWLSGVAFALCIIAGCAHAAEIAAVLGGVSLTTFLTGIWL